MLDTRFGPASGFFARLRPARVGAAELREIADALLPTLSIPGLHTAVMDRPMGGALVVLREDERTLRVPLGDLAEDMTDAGVAPTRTAITAALATWVAHRPVTDAAAAASGIAVVDWADTDRARVGWRVVVRRGELALPWQPSAAADRAVVHRIRSAALGRAAEVRLDLHVEGPLALLSHAGAPVLASAGLVDPEGLLARIEAAGLPMPDMHVVVTPNRPVACAPGGGVAARLAGQTSEPSVTLPWLALRDLPWA